MKKNIQATADFLIEMLKAFQGSGRRTFSVIAEPVPNDAKFSHFECDERGVVKIWFDTAEGGDESISPMIQTEREGGE